MNIGKGRKKKRHLYALVFSKIPVFAYFGRAPAPSGVGLCGTPVGRCCAPRLAACTYYPSRAETYAGSRLLAFPLPILSVRG
jgi:hypothetical protein